MPFQMIYADKRLSQANGQTFCGAIADEERSEEPRSARSRDTVNLGKGATRTQQGRLDEGSDSRQMIPGSDFRNNSPIHLVQVYLASDFGGQNFPGSPQ
jgi:hypothetical protein